MANPHSVFQGASQPTKPSEHEEEPTRYASFILRCWQDRGERVHARLIDVGSGASYPVRDLGELPDLVCQLVSRTLFGPSQACMPTQITSRKGDKEER